MTKKINWLLVTLIIIVLTMFILSFLYINSYWNKRECLENIGTQICNARGLDFYSVNFYSLSDEGASLECLKDRQTIEFKFNKYEMEEC